MAVNITNEVLIPKGYKAAGAHIGIKKQRKDLSLVTSDTPAVCAGCYTQNLVKAAPVIRDSNITQSLRKVRGVVTNSGNANACTGERGLKDCDEMAALFAKHIGCSKEEVLVCSTGVIGVPLPMDIISKGITQTTQELGTLKEDFYAAAEAVTTTDTFTKIASTVIEIGGKTVTLYGFAKGSGMIHPDMATLLSYCFTDCAISQAALNTAFDECTAVTFNMISVDGDTSTNDTALILANGAAGNTVIESCEGADYELFKAALFEVMKELAVMVAKDGEGASKLIEVTVMGARSVNEARTLAKSVVSSNLVKAAFFGADANYGRIACAMGYSGAWFGQAGLKIEFESAAGRFTLMQNGEPIAFDEELAKKILSESKIITYITLKDGEHTATAWGCDLTYDYVKINGDYRT